MFLENIETEKFIELYKKNKDELEIIDVRETSEYEESHVVGSKLIPMNEVINRLDEIDWKKKVIFICRSGARSGYIGGIVKANYGREILNLQDGMIGLLSNKVENIIE